MLVPQERSTSAWNELTLSPVLNFCSQFTGTEGNDRRSQGMVRQRMLAAITIVAFAILLQAAHVAAQHATDMKALPTLKIVAPANGAVVHKLVFVIFETPANVAKMTMGTEKMDMTGPHVHIAVDKHVNMPAIKQLLRTGANRYRFTVGAFKSGRHTIRVYWADAKTHKPMGSIQQVTVTVK